MAITAFSKRFKRELDVQQLQNLYQQLPDVIELSEFIKVDIECPCCGVTGGRIVKEGISPITKLAVKQAHFAFKSENGRDAHLVFCDYYSGEETQNRKTNDAIVNLSKSQNKITEVVRKLVCSAIHNGIFKQTDIRNMREWFFEMRSTQDFLVESSKHQLNIIRKAFWRRNKHQYVIDKSIVNEDWFDLDNEVYESLAINFPYPMAIDEPPNIDGFFFKQANVKKAISLSKKNHGLYGFDRSRLEEKYQLAIKLSLKVMSSASFEKKFGYTMHLSHLKARTSNPLMAYSATLLFVNNWNIDSALEMHDIILKSTTNDENLGNVIGLNPFINYEAWVALKFCSCWNKKILDYDFDKEYLKERDRLKEIYQIN